MTTPKRKISVSLDEDLVQEMEQADETLSAQINEAIRKDVEARRRNRLLLELVDELEKVHGSVRESEVQKYMDLLA